MFLIVIGTYTVFKCKTAVYPALKTFSQKTQSTRATNSETTSQGCILSHRTEPALTDSPFWTWNLQFSPARASASGLQTSSSIFMTVTSAPPG